MRTSHRPTTLIGTVAVVLILGALLAPAAPARPDGWKPQPELGSPQDGSPSKSEGFDWGLFAMFAALGGIAVLGAGAVIAVRERTRLA